MLSGRQSTTALNSEPSSGAFGIGEPRVAPGAAGQPEDVERCGVGASQGEAHRAGVAAPTCPWELRAGDVSARALGGPMRGPPDRSATGRDAQCLALNDLDDEARISPVLDWYLGAEQPAEGHLTQVE